MEPTATDNLTLQPVRGKFPVVGVWRNGPIVERDGTLRAVGPSPTHHNLYLRTAIEKLDSMPRLGLTQAT